MTGQLDKIKFNRYAFVTYEGKYRQEHRVVMENFLGRKLTDQEVIHHKNGLRWDNRIENLQIMTNEDHSRHHRGWNGFRYFAKSASGRILRFESSEDFIRAGYKQWSVSNACLKNIPYRGMTWWKEKPQRAPLPDSAAVKRILSVIKKRKIDGTYLHPERLTISDPSEVINKLSTYRHEAHQDSLRPRDEQPEDLRRGEEPRADPRR